MSSLASPPLTAPKSLSAGEMAGRMALVIEMKLDFC